MKISAIPFTLVATLIGVQASAYTLNGRITEVASAKYPNNNNTHCYIKIEDRHNDYYSNKAHAINNSSMCGLARTAYFLGVPVTAAAKVDNNGANYANDITKIIVQNQELQNPR